MNADQLTLQRAAKRHRIASVAEASVGEREILPCVVQMSRARHWNERQRSVVGKAVVGAGAEVGYRHPDRVADAVPIGVGEVPQVERAIVEDAVVAPGKSHEAAEGSLVDDLGIAGNGA